MVAHIMACLPYLPDRGAEVVVPCPLHGKELVLPAEAVIAVQAGCHEVKKHVGQKEQEKEYKAKKDVKLP